MLNENAPAVRGVALDLKQAQMAIHQVPDRPGMASKFVQALADQNIGLDMIIQSQRSRPVNGQKTRDIAFTVPAMDLPQAQEIVEALAQSLGCGEVTADPNIAKVSIVGIGMLGRPGVAAEMFKALSDQNINIQMIATSEIRVSCVVAESEGVPALQAIHAAFGLGQESVLEVPA
jgi:aspartate kinase